MRIAILQIINGKLAEALQEKSKKIKKSKSVNSKNSKKAKMCLQIFTPSPSSATPFMSGTD
jgi:hypothetical protein